MATPQMQRSVPAVLHDIVDNLQDIIRSEFCLAKTELKEQAAAATRPVATLGAGIFAAIYGAGFLLLAAVYGLSRVMADWQAALLVGAACAVFGMILVSASKSKLKRLSLKPERTMHSLEENVQWAKHPTK